MLPIDIPDDARHVLWREGVRFPKTVLYDSDRKRLNITLPQGWRQVPSQEHDGLDILDDRGRKRAEMFIVESGSDQAALLRTVRRFNLHEETYSYKGDNYVRVVILDCGESVSPIVGFKFYGEADYRLQLRKAYEIAEKRLNTHYRNWESHAAWWDFDRLPSWKDRLRLALHGKK